MKKDLFEDITRGLPDCHYISDLRTMIEKKRNIQLKNVLYGFKYDDYSVQQWDELIHYLFKDDETHKSSEEAYKKICEYLEK